MQYIFTLTEDTMFRDNVPLSPWWRDVLVPAGDYEVVEAAHNGVNVLLSGTVVKADLDSRILGYIHPTGESQTEVGKPWDFRLFYYKFQITDEPRFVQK